MLVSESRPSNPSNVVRFANRHIRRKVHRAASYERAAEVSFQQPISHRLQTDSFFHPFMAKNSHVPKFGNWERENVSYTMYFENARRDKGAGVRIINPNDPEQNPDALIIYRTLTHESETKEKLHRENSDDFVSHHDVHAPPQQIGFDKDMNVMKQQEKKHLDIEGSSDSIFSHRRVVLDPQRSRSHKSRTSESGSDKSSSDFSHLKSHCRRGMSPESKSSAEGGNSLIPSPPKLALLNYGNAGQGEALQRVASVPKFGAWDEADPRSGEGFTAIFDKVKEEKQIGAAKFPAVAVGQSIDQLGHKNHDNSGKKIKIRCCLFSRGEK